MFYIYTLLNPLKHINVYLYDLKFSETLEIYYEPFYVGYTKILNTRLLKHMFDYTNKEKYNIINTLQNKNAPLIMKVLFGNISDEFEAKTIESYYINLFNSRFDIVNKKDFYFRPITLESIISKKLYTTYLDFNLVKYFSKYDPIQKIETNELKVMFN